MVIFNSYVKLPEGISMQFLFLRIRKEPPFRSVSTACFHPRLGERVDYLEKLLVESAEKHTQDDSKLREEEGPVTFRGFFYIHLASF